MKLKGKTLPGLTTGTVTIQRPGTDGETESFRLKLVPLPGGWDRLMRSRGLIGYRPAPQKVRLVDGKPFINPETRQAEFYEDDEDPEYLRMLNKYYRRLQAMRLASHLRADEDIQFEAKEPAGKDKDEWLKYADALVQEVVDFGLTDQEVDEIVRVADSLSVSVEPDEGFKAFLARTSSAAP